MHHSMHHDASTGRANHGDASCRTVVITGCMRESIDVTLGRPQAQTDTDRDGKDGRDELGWG